jgi:hypothetical protein
MRTTSSHPHAALARSVRLLAACLLGSALLAAGAMAQSSPVSPVQGRILKAEDKVWFVDNAGHRFTLEGEAGIFFKYANYRLEILNPVFPTSDSIRFTQYRILESDNGELIDSTVRKILSVKGKQPALDFQIQPRDGVFRFTLYLTNRGDAPIRLRFPSSQRFDFVVMTTDEKTTLWRWSWGRTFDIGFNDLIVGPNAEIHFDERWDYLRSYVEDGEYIAFAEVHCLPHGILSEIRKFIVQSSRLQMSFQNSFLPLETGNNWVYRRPDSGEILRVDVTGTARLDGKEYRVLSAFPDARALGPDGRNPEGDSRLVRFDAGANRYVEWTPDGEQALLQTDETHRLVPAEGPCPAAGGRYDYCLELRELVNKKWEPLYTIIPGIGLSRAFVPRPGGPPVQWDMAEARLGSAPAPPRLSGAEVPAGSEFRVVMHKFGGIPPVDTSYSLKSDGSVVVMENGALARQGVMPVARLWELVQAIDQDGVFQLNEQYGADDIDDPLQVELRVEVGTKSKSVRMRTSAKDKPPLSFWNIVSRIEQLMKNSP